MGAEQDETEESLTSTGELRTHEEAPPPRTPSYLRPVAPLAGLGMLGASFYLLNFDRGGLNAQLFLMAGVALLFVGSASESLAYLRAPSRRSTGPEERQIREVRNLRQELQQQREALRAALDELKSSRGGGTPALTLTDSERRSIVDKLQSVLIAEPIAEALREKHNDEERDVERRLRRRQLIRTRQFGVSAADRLRTEIEALTRRGNLNLAIGTATTMAALAVLSSVALFPPFASDKTTLLLHYIPRGSIAIFVEVFAFFFLRLYKNSLEEIKYYQNEITNIEMKTMGLRLCAEHPKDDMLLLVLKSLADTERNFKLAKGESTLQLEQSKLDSVRVDEILGQLAKIVPKLGAKQ